MAVGSAVHYTEPRIRKSPAQEPRLPFKDDEHIMPCCNGSLRFQDTPSLCECRQASLVSDLHPWTNNIMTAMGLY